MNDERKTYTGTWSCSMCGDAITELPFEPRSEGNLKCKSCFAKGKEGAPKREMYQGNWKCGQCGSAITELPFQPRDEGSLTCRGCYQRMNASS